MNAAKKINKKLNIDNKIFNMTTGIHLYKLIIKVQTEINGSHWFTSN